MRVYLAGPMRGLPQFNFPAFDAGAATLEALGHEVFNPADRDRGTGFTTKGLTGHEDLAAMGFSLREALAADTWWISRKADAVALLPGWQKSSGVAAEIALAHALGLPVGELASFDEDGPTETLEAPHGSSGSVKDAARRTESEQFFAVWDPKNAAAGEFGRNTGRVSLAKSILGEGLITEAAARENLAKNGFLPAFTSDSPGVKLRSGEYVAEVRTTSATGGEKGTKPERYDLIPVGALSKVAALYGRGAAKYEAHNWRKGYEWSKSYAALQRHATQFWNGEDNDAEMDLPHMASVAFHALALLTFMEEHPGFDDRYKPEATEPGCCDGVLSACSDCHASDLGACS